MFHIFGTCSGTLPRAGPGLPCRPPWSVLFHIDCRLESLSFDDLRLLWRVENVFLIYVERHWSSGDG